jgi:hypothetical protein
MIIFIVGCICLTVVDSITYLFGLWDLRGFYIFGCVILISLCRLSSCIILLCRFIMVVCESFIDEGMSF